MLRYLEDCDLAGNQLAHVECVGPLSPCPSLSRSARCTADEPRRSFELEPNARYSKAVYGPKWARVGAKGERQTNDSAPAEVDGADDATGGTYDSAQVRAATGERVQRHARAGASRQPAV